MKKLVSILLMLAMILSFAACGNTEEPLYSQGLKKNGFYDVKALDYVTLPEYEGIEIPAEELVADEVSLQSQINSILSSAMETEEITDRAIEDGDSVNIDYAGYCDGEQFEGGTAEDQTVTAGGSDFIDDFLTQIIGHMPGETFDIDVTFPDPYENNADLAGKDATFTITVNYIEESVMPELTDEFVSEHYGQSAGLNTVDDLKNYLSESIVESQLREYVDQYLFGASEFGEVPEMVIEHQKNCIKANYDDMATTYGLDVATLVSYYGYEDLDALIEDNMADVEEMGKDALMYQAIAEKMNLKVSNTDVADYFEKNSGTRDYSSSENHYGLAYLKLMVMRTMIVDKIVEAAVK